MTLTLVTAPAAEPISLTEAKAHMRLDVSTEDTHTSSMITAARQYIEKAYGVRLINSTWDLKLPGFPSDAEGIVFDYRPLSSVSSISYVDADGDTQVLASSVYTVDAAYKDGRGRIVLAYDQQWPLTRSVVNAVTVRHVAGFGAAGSNVPESIRMALLMLISDWNENRESSIVGTITVPVLHGIAALMANEAA